MSFNSSIDTGGQSNPVTKSYSDGLKGFFSLLIVSNHLTASMCGDVFLEELFRNIGFVCVAFFFFVSGWGTMAGYTCKPQYLNGFISNKTKKIMAPYAVAVILYTTAEVATGATLKECIVSFCIGAPVAKYSWYVISVFILYIGFWFAFWQKRMNPFLMLFIENIVYCFIFMALKWPMCWYNTYIAFFAGAVMYEKKDAVGKWKGKKALCAVAAGILTIALLFTSYFEMNRLSLAMYWLGTVAVCILIFMGSIHIIFKGHFWQHIATISFELYLYHGLTNSILKHIGFIWQSNYIYLAVAYVCAIGMAYLMHRFDVILIKKITVFERHFLGSKR